MRFELSEPASAAGYCHCTRCQRRTGTAASAQARIDGRTFRIVRGAELVKAWRHPDDGFEKCFCRECGAHLFSRNADDPTQMSVRMGAFNLGLGAALALGLTRWPGHRVALWAAAFAAVLHAGSHFADQALGGNSSDPLVLSLIAVALVAAAILATRTNDRAREVTRDATTSPSARIPGDRSARTTQPD